MNTDSAHFSFPSLIASVIVKNFIPMNKQQFVVLIICTIAPISTYAYQFIPTELEFNLWDIRCKATYAGTDVGSRSKFAELVPPTLVKEYRIAANTAPNSRGGPWHYCASLIHLNRAKFAPNSEEAKKHYMRALGEAKYTYQRISKKDPWAYEMAVTLGRIENGLKNYKQAEKYYKQAIKLNPSSGLAYTALALQYRKRGKLKQAIKILIQAEKIITPPSAEIYYFLGIFSLENNDIQKANLYSEKAYELGYPLPYLKNKLQKLQSAK